MWGVFSFYVNCLVVENTVGLWGKQWVLSVARCKNSTVYAMAAVTRAGTKYPLPQYRSDKSIVSASCFMLALV